MHLVGFYHQKKMRILRLCVNIMHLVQIRASKDACLLDQYYTLIKWIQYSYNNNNNLQ